MREPLPRTRLGKYRRFLLPRSNLAREVIPEGLRAAGATVDAVEAWRIGLINGLIEDEDFIDTVHEQARAIGAASFAVAHAKRLVRLGAEDPMEAALARESEAQEECFDSADFREGLDAFVDKRRAEFKGG